MQTLTSWARLGVASLTMSTCGALLALLLAGSLSSRALGEPKPLTTQTALETTRFLWNAGSSAFGPRSIALGSPDGRHYVVRTVQGDVRRDGDWLRVYEGGLESLDAAKHLSLVAELFTRGFEHQPRNRFLLDEAINPFVWTDSTHVAFRWEDRNDIAQIISVDVRTRVVRYLTRSPTDIMYFSVGPRGQLLYATKDEVDVASAETDFYGGTYVTADDGFALGEGRLVGGGALARMYDRQFFLLRSRGASPLPLNLRARMASSSWLFQPRWSADGNFVIVDAWAGRSPVGWHRFLGKTKSFLDRVLATSFEQPESWFGRDATQLYLVDTRLARATPLLNVPTLDFGENVTVAWSPSNSALVVGPTLLPIQLTDSKRPGARGVATVDLRSGRISPLPLSEQEAALARQLEWTSATEIAVTSQGTGAVFGDDHGQWVRRSSINRKFAPSPAIALVEREGLNTPPKLFAVDPQSRREVLVFDPNPGLLEKVRLGGVAKLTWTDRFHEGRAGLLYYPTSFSRGRRYPLVIQVCPGAGAGSLSAFDLYGSLTGAGTGPSLSIYSAQQLANSGVMVLAVSHIAADGHMGATSDVDANIELFNSAIERLTNLGLIDPERVGIGGISRPGWVVAQTITHSSFPYAAAVVSDAADSGYVSGTLYPGGVDLENGSPPFGTGLKNWLERAAGFNAEQIRTPLRLEDESQAGGELLSSWELFSRLRTLHLPVEFYVIPDIERGSHVLQNPHQIIAAKDGAIDWFDFWLTGYEDPNPKKKGTYLRWEGLRNERDLASKNPRPPALTWTATPSARLH